MIGLLIMRTPPVKFRINFNLIIKNLLIYCDSGIFFLHTFSNTYEPFFSMKAAKNNFTYKIMNSNYSEAIWNCKRSMKEWMELNTNEENERKESKQHKEKVNRN